MQSIPKAEMDTPVSVPDLSAVSAALPLKDESVAVSETVESSPLEKYSSQSRGLRRRSERLDSSNILDNLTTFQRYIRNCLGSDTVQMVDKDQ
ncbi:hypothetical protein CYMTET_32095, partial [Cymbomonas tetramitiformis]